MFPCYFGFLTKRCWVDDCVKRLVLGGVVCVSINSLEVAPSIGIAPSLVLLEAPCIQQAHFQGPSVLSNLSFSCASIKESCVTPKDPLPQT